MISNNTLRSRVSDFVVQDWIMDSGAFSQIFRHGKFVLSPVDYAAQIRRWVKCGNMLAAVSQDYMCEGVILDRTGMTVRQHQLITVQNYCTIASYVSGAAYVMPVLQGYEPWEYLDHIRQYGSLLADGAWVGVGSVCKRNARVEAVEDVLMAIRGERPDLRLHGFGLKITALASSVVRDCLHSADSMAWSYAARRAGRDANDASEAVEFVNRIEKQVVRKRQYQPNLFTMTSE